MVSPRSENVSIKQAETRDTATAAGVPESRPRPAPPAPELKVRRPPASRPARLPAPGHADQEAEAERETDGRQRALGDDVFQRLLDRGGGIVRRIHHGAAAVRQVVD